MTWIALLVLLSGPAVDSPEDPAGAEVVWSAPEGCPDRAMFLAGVARRRGRPLEAGQVRVVARVSAVGPERYRLELELDAGGRREARVLDARSCAALADAAALRIAVALDGEPGRSKEVAGAPAEPGAVEAESGGDESPDGVAPREGAGPPDFAAEPEEEAARAIAGAHPEESQPSEIADVADEVAPAADSAGTRGPGGAIRLVGLGEYGALPGPSGGVGLAGALLWPRARMEVRGVYVAPRGTTHPAAEVRTSLVAGAVVGCARPGRGALEVPICGGVELGGVIGSAEGPGLQRRAIGLWVAGLVAAGVAWRVRPRLALWGAIEGLAAARRPTFVLQDPGPEVVLFDPGVLSGRLALGIELGFGDRRDDRQ